ncbi:MAG: DUF3842 family protein [Oscillospiraceae bacterium]|nr:DUF3842 family protein [Oscillospiraceae bacterium]
MNILVIDGQGGRLGSRIIEELKSSLPSASLTAVGTNSAATAAMLRAGADAAATGENAVIVACRRCDGIIGPIGMVIAEARGGELAPKMAVAVAQADAVRVMIPFNRCENIVAGIEKQTMQELITDAAAKLKTALGA